MPIGVAMVKLLKKFVYWVLEEEAGVNGHYREAHYWLKKRMALDNGR
jgi:hypothetical protein